MLAPEDEVREEDILFRHKSPFQLIELWDVGHGQFSLVLDGNTQFISGEEDEGVYHDALAGCPARMLTKPTKSLVLGGGDGLAVRDLLRVPHVIDITIVEIDPDMIELAKSHRLLTEANEGSMRHPKVSSVAMDARKFLYGTPDKFGLIIIDFPDPILQEHKPLYELPFYKGLSKVMEERPVVSVQTSGAGGPIQTVVSRNLEGVTGSKSHVAYFDTASLGHGSVVYGGAGVDSGKIKNNKIGTTSKKSTGLF